MKQGTAFACLLLALLATSQLIDAATPEHLANEERKSASVNSSGPMKFRQYDLLRERPDDAAPFVPFSMPEKAPPPVKEELRLHYRFKYPFSRASGICGSALFDETLVGFRKIVDKKP